MPWLISDPLLAYFCWHEFMRPRVLCDMTFLMLLRDARNGLCSDCLGWVGRCAGLGHSSVVVLCCGRTVLPVHYREDGFPRDCRSVLGYLGRSRFLRRVTRQRHQRRWSGCRSEAKDPVPSTGLPASDGLAPAPRDSGRISGTHHRPRRYDRRLLRVFYLSGLWAFKSCPASRRYYDRKRAEGKIHIQAMLSLAQTPAQCPLGHAQGRTTYTPVPVPAAQLAG